MVSRNRVVHLAIEHVLGGDILVRSTVGQGSCFTFVLPIQCPDEEDLVHGDDLAHQSVYLRSRAAKPIPRHFQGRILVAEDSRDNQRILSYLLENAGLSVTIAVNGRIAVEKATTANYDLILMDMQMPELDGYAATSLLRQMGYHQPIIALTAHTMRGDQEKCLQAGCTSYLAKPIDREVFFSLLSQYLPRHCKGLSVDPLTARPQRSIEPIVSKYVGDNVLMELVPEYLASLDGHLKEILNAMDRQDYKRVAALAHQTRGGAGMYGYPVLSELAGLIEDAVRDRQDSSLLIELVEEFEELIDRMHSVILAPRRI